MWVFTVVTATEKVDLLHPPANVSNHLANQPSNNHTGKTGLDITNLSMVYIEHSAGISLYLTKPVQPGLQSVIFCLFCVTKPRTNDLIEWLAILSW